MQLNWVYGECFVKPEAYNTVFRPLGVGFRPVLKYKSDIELSTVVQLDVTDSVPLEMGDGPYETCPVCSRKKY